MAKRYVTGKYEIYDDRYVRLKNESQILSGGGGIPSLATIFFDRRNLEALAKYLSTERIPFLEEKLQELSELWDKVRQEVVNQGYSYPTDDQMPKELLEKQLLLFASLDVANEELIKVTDRITNFKEEKEINDNDQVLKWGLRQSVKLLDNICHKIDGQKCSKTEDGIIIINDERSPYNGMQVAQYRALAEQWRADELVRDTEELKRSQAIAREKGLPVTDQYSSIGRIVLSSELPAWPEGVKNFLEPEKVEIEETEE